MQIFLSVIKSGEHCLFSFCSSHHQHYLSILVCGWFWVYLLGMHKKWMKTVANIHGNMSKRLHKHNDMHYNLLVWLNPFEHIVSTWTLSNKLLKFIAHWTYTIDHHNTKIQCITASIHRIRMQVNEDTSIHTIHIALLLRKPKWQRKIRKMCTFITQTHSHRPSIPHSTVTSHTATERTKKRTNM